MADIEETKSNIEIKDEGEKFEIVSDKVVFRRFETIWERRVRYPNGEVMSFDVMGTEKSDFTNVIVFPFDCVTRTVTMLREYSPGSHAMKYGFVGGMFEKDKHDSPEDAARAELSEEAHLKATQLIPLTKSSVSADKYNRNHNHFFLALNCVPDENPKTGDHDEFIRIHGRFELSRVREMLDEGCFNTVFSLLAMLAIDELRKRNYT